MERTKNNSYTNLFKMQVAEEAIKLGNNRQTAKDFGINEENVYMSLDSNTTSYQNGSKNEDLQNIWLDLSGLLMILACNEGQLMILACKDH